MFNEDYIISLPSGEVVYAKEREIYNLQKIRIVDYNIEINDWFCEDVNLEYVKDYILKNNKTFSKEEIFDFLISLDLERDQFKIFDNLSVDVYAPVFMSNKKLHKIPINFNRATSNFDCSFNYLTTLENSPKIVHGNFNCSYNFLQNLVGGPLHVSKGYNCGNNKLNSLKGSPRKVSFFNCSNNNLNNLTDVPETDICLSINNPLK